MSKKVNLGDFTHKIIIQYNAKAGQTDDNCNPAYDWKPIIDKVIWAKKTGLKGRLFYQAAVANAEDDVMYTIHYRNDIKAGMQVVEGTRTYDIYISPIDPDDRKMWLQLHCKEVLQNGG